MIRPPFLFLTCTITKTLLEQLINTNTQGHEGSLYV